MGNRSRRSNKRSQLLPDPTFIIDADLANVVGAAIEEGGYTALRVVDKFAEGTDDAEFLPTLGAEGLVFISHDKRQRTRPQEYGAIARAGVWVFYIVGCRDKFEMAARLRLHLEEIVRLYKKYAPPAMFRLLSTSVEHVKHAHLPALTKRSAVKKPPRAAE